MEKFNIESTVLLSFKCWGFDGYFFYEAFYIHKLFQAINSIDWHHIQTNLLTHLNIKRSLFLDFDLTWWDFVFFLISVTEWNMSLFPLCLQAE